MLALGACAGYIRVRVQIHKMHVLMHATGCLALNTRAKLYDFGMDEFACTIVFLILTVPQLISDLTNERESVPYYTSL